MVMAPASTGSDSNNRKAVTSTLHTNKGILCRVMPGARMLNIVVMKLIAPRMEEAPAKCSGKDRKIHGRAGMPAGRKRRIDGPARADTNHARRPFDEQGDDRAARRRPASSQNEILFMRGKAMSGAPIIAARTSCRSRRSLPASP